MLCQKKLKSQGVSQVQDRDHLNQIETKNQTIGRLSLQTKEDLCDHLGLIVFKGVAFVGNHLPDSLLSVTETE